MDESEVSVREGALLAPFELSPRVALSIVWSQQKTSDSECPDETIDELRWGLFLVRCRIGELGWAFRRFGLSVWRLLFLAVNAGWKRLLPSEAKPR